MKNTQSEIWRKKRLKTYKKAKNKPTPKPETKVSPKKKSASLPHLHLPQIHLHTKNKSVNKFLKRHDSDLQLILFPMILLVIVLILALITNRLNTKQDPTINQSTTLNPYPYVQALHEPQVTAKAAIIVDTASQVMLFAKNPQLRFSMASTTKIMTALTALDYYKSEDILTVKRIGVEGSGLGLYAGEQFRFTDLLYAMLLPSANDAAQAIADNYPGGSDAFVKRMNEKAQELHLTNTHFSDPTGLEDDGDYTTVIDMARLASYAINNPTFVTITSTKYKTITNVQFTRQYPLTNLNKLLGIEGVTGIKTGTTEGAGEVLVTSTIKNGHTYIIVVMHSEDRFTDTSTLLHYIDANVQYILPQQLNK